MMKKTSFLLMFFALLAISCSSGGEVVGGDPNAGSNNSGNTGGGNTGGGNTGGGNSGGGNSGSVAPTHIAKVLIHDFTGTWCGNCADAIYTVKAVHDKYPDKVISVGVHRERSGFNDDGSFTYEKYSKFGVQGTPTIWFNNDKNPLQNATLEELATNGIANKKEIGLAINYDLNSNKVNVKVRYDNVSSNNKLVVYMVEDKLKADQTNYANNDSSSLAYQKGDPIPNFEHSNVLRASLTEPLGNAIPDNEISNKLYTVEYALTTTAKGKFKDISNSKVIAYVVDKNGKIVNAQIAKANEDKDFN